MTKLPPEESVIRIPSHVSWYLNFVVRRSDSISTSRASWGHQGISWHLPKNGLSLPKRMIHWRFDLTQKWDQTTDTGTANPSKHHSTALNELTIWYSKHLEKCQFREISSTSSPRPTHCDPQPCCGPEARNAAVRDQPQQTMWATQDWHVGLKEDGIGWISKFLKVFKVKLSNCWVDL